MNELDKHDDAINAYDNAIKINPEFAEAWYHKGIALLALGRFTESKDALAKAQDLGYTELPPINLRRVNGTKITLN